jgi:hypothetical protein
LTQEERQDLKWRYYSKEMAPEDRATAVVYLNVLEEVAGAYNLGLLHKPTAKLESDTSQLHSGLQEAGSSIAFALRRNPRRCSESGSR